MAYPPRPWTNQTMTTNHTSERQKRTIEQMMPYFITDPELRKGPKHQRTVTWMNQVQQTLERNVTWYRFLRDGFLEHEYPPTDDGIRSCLRSNMKRAEEEKERSPVPVDQYLHVELPIAIYLLEKRERRRQFRAEQMAKEVDKAVEKALAKQKKRVSFNANKEEEERVGKAIAQRQRILHDVREGLLELRAEISNHYLRVGQRLDELSQELMELPVGDVVKDESGNAKRSSFKEGSLAQFSGGSQQDDGSKGQKKRQSRLSSLFHRS